MSRGGRRGGGESEVVPALLLSLLMRSGQPGVEQVGESSSEMKVSRGQLV